MAVWTLGLLIGLGFAVVGHVDATNTLPLQNRQLIAEGQTLASQRDPLQESLGIERDRSERFRQVIGMQNQMLFEAMSQPKGSSLRSWPREE